ncbi:MAG: glycosyltransferase family 2 protein [Pseudomonadota bacterium]
MTDLAISIINYRTGEMTIAAVASVLTALGDRDAKVVVVDNASGDGSADEIAAWIDKTGDPRAILVRSATNSGFSGGHNQGMAAAPGADFYLILNSDAVLRPSFFDAILAAADANPSVGMIAPRLEWDDGPPQQSCFRFASPQSEIIRGAGSGPVTKMLASHVVALDLPPDPDQIEWASFACILLRGDMVRALGDMDDGYFLYFEDAEYALRATRAGWGVVYAPEAKAVHFRGGSGPVKKIQAARKRLPAYYWRSRTRFFRQAHGPLGPLLANVGWIAGRVLAHTRLLAGRSVPPSNQSEWRDIWTGFFQPLAQAPETRK